MKHNTKLVGRVYLKVWRDGQLIIDRYEGENIITNTGKAQVALLMGDASATPFTYLALGSNSTAAAATDTTLNTEITNHGLARAAATVSRITTTTTNDTLSLAYTWTVTTPGGDTIKEIGIFNASSSGTMLGRKVVSDTLTATNDVVQYTYTVQVT